MMRYPEEFDKLIFGAQVSIITMIDTMFFPGVRKH